MKRVALLSCATVALALRPVPPPPRAVQSKAAKKVAAGMAAAVLAGASTLPLASLALSADDYDAIYGMSSTGSKGSSIKFEMPSFGGDDAPDTAAADKKKADDAAAAKEAAAAAKAAEREAAREARAKQQQELRDAAKKREEEAQAKKDAAIAKAKAATAAASKKEDAAPAFKPPDSFSAPSLPTFDAPKVEMPSMPSFSASPLRINHHGLHAIDGVAVWSLTARFGQHGRGLAEKCTRDSLIGSRAGAQARCPLHAFVLSSVDAFLLRAVGAVVLDAVDAETRRESQCMNQIVAACLTDRCAHRPLRRPLRCRRHRSCRTLQRWICHRSRRVTVHKTNCRRLSGAPDSLVDFLTGP